MLSKIILCASVFYLVASRNIEKEGDQFVLEIPEGCPAKGGCTLKPKGYEEMMAKIEKLLPEYLKQNYTDRYGNELEPPVKHDLNDVNNCAYQVVKKEFTSYDHHHLVQNGGFKQVIEEVKCLNENLSSNRAAGEECFKEVISKDFGQESACKTIDKAYTLYTVTSDLKAIVPKVFTIPACCSCVVTNK